jgi:hypothetical protein
LASVTGGSLAVASPSDEDRDDAGDGSDGFVLSLSLPSRRWSKLREIVLGAAEAGTADVGAVSGLTVAEAGVTGFPAVAGVGWRWMKLSSR